MAESSSLLDENNIFTGGRLTVETRDMRKFSQEFKKSELFQPIQARTQHLSTGEFAPKWTRLFSFFFPSDEYDSAPIQNYSRSLLNV